jgi:hypothetical protein
MQTTTVASRVRNVRPSPPRNTLTSVVGQLDPRTGGGVYAARRAAGPSVTRQPSPTPVMTAPRST